jgi:acyl carrier protein
MKNAAYITGRPELCEQLKLVWSGLLEVPVEAVGDDSDFLELGGNSMLLLSLQVEVARSLGVELAYSELLSCMRFADFYEQVLGA